MEQLHKQEFQQRYELLLPAIQTLGKEAVRLFDGREIEKWDKPDGTKVTTADINLNQQWIDIIAMNFPDDLVWGEEGCNIPEGQFGTKGDLEAAGKRWMWLIDPIDGTSGFWRAYQSNERSDCSSAIMITAFAPGETLPTLSAVHNPFIRHPFTVISSEQYGTEYYTTRAKEPRQVIIPSSFVTKMSEVERFEENRWVGAVPDLRVIKDMAPYARKVRTSSVGAAMSRLALGDIDIVAFPGPANPHDVSPGALIAHQAGAVVRDLEGRDYSQIDWRVAPIAGCFAVANSELADDFLVRLSAA